jgi:hypothetical protein
MNPGSNIQHSRLNIQRPKPKMVEGKKKPVLTPALSSKERETFSQRRS